MSTPISTNVPLIFGNLVTLERLKVVQGMKGTFLYIISPWIRDVIFPISEFGIYNPDLGTAATLTSEIIRGMSRKGVDINVCTLHYFSEVLPYKNSLDIYNPASRIQQAFRNIEELEVLGDFQTEGASIYLNKNFHSKIIASSTGLYKGSFNFTLSGYYKNREDGYYIPNSVSTGEQFEQELFEIKNEFLRTDFKTSPKQMEKIRLEHEEIIKETRKNWDDLMRRYVRQAKRNAERKIFRHGLVI